MKYMKRLFLLLAVVLSLCLFAAAADHTAATKGELYALLFENLQEQDDYFSIEYTGNMADLPRENGTVSPALLVREMSAALPNPDGAGPDVLMMNIREIRYTQANKLLAFTVDYLLDAQQLNWVDTQADSIVKELQLENLTDYAKIKKIYQYMGTNFTYDRTLTKYTDYDGLTTGSMVCQGYALLTYKLMWKSGIPCRIVVGISSNESHGWNIVKLDGKWYNLDTTWDSKDEGTPMYWRYFLRSNEDFIDHLPDVAFQSEAFLQNYSIAEKSYEVPSVEILIDGVLYSALTIRNGKTTQLQASLNPQKDIPVTWTSSDNAVVSVDETGLIESLIPGAVYITATAADPNYIPGVFPVTAVDLRTCSEWADAELNSYYLRKLYPAILCSDYQNPIKRDEFAHLLYQLAGSYMVKGGQYHYPGFEDVEDASPYWFSIVYTASRGFFQGTGEKTFSPKAELTREQAAKLLCTVMDYAAIPFESNTVKIFSDADAISPWAKEYVDRAAGAELLIGDGDTFRPQDPITREEAGVMLERLFVRFIEPTLAQPAA